MKGVFKMWMSIFPSLTLRLFEIHVIYVLTQKMKFYNLNCSLPPAWAHSNPSKELERLQPEAVLENLEISS